MDKLTCLYFRKCGGYLAAGIGPRALLCKSCQRSADLGPKAKTPKPKPVQRTAMEKLLGEFVPRSLDGSSHGGREDQSGPKQAYPCSDCKRTPVSRQGNVCRKCRRKATYVADEQHGLLETPYRGRNWAANLRSEDELNGEDVVRKRDLGRWHRPGKSPAQSACCLGPAWSWNCEFSMSRTIRSIPRSPSPGTSATTTWTRWPKSQWTGPGR
jgi:hypothetical protein